MADLSWLELDVHAHILPGLDSGATDLVAALQYLKSLAALGFRKLTVHR